MNVALAVGVVVVGIGLVWRWSSHRWSIPCPVWLGAGVDLPLVGTVFGTDRTLARIDAWPGRRVLEIGPGPGRLLIPLAVRVKPHGEAVGVDIHPGMIAQLQARGAAAGVTNLVGLVADATTMAPPGEFDTVVFALAFGEIPDREATLRKCLRGCYAS
jgi:ubiquinone/menaquinone biosynthesis C-methylase UbiE